MQIAQSPFKAQLAKKTAALTPLKEITREVIATGRQSVVLAEGDNHVLLVTPYLVAKQNLELLRKLNTRTCPFACPQLVALNANLGELINPLNPDKARNFTKKQFSIMYPKIWYDNVVYQLPRFDGTLEDLKEYSEESINQLNKTLTESLTFLHKNGLTHNDLSLKNIFYSGQHPHLQFHLGDFGSVTKNSKITHETLRLKDFMRLGRVVAQAQKILERKRKSSIEKEKLNQLIYNYGNSRKRKRLDQETPDIIEPAPKRVARKLHFL